MSSSGSRVKRRGSSLSTRFDPSITTSLNRVLKSRHLHRSLVVVEEVLPVSCRRPRSVSEYPVTHVFLVLTPDSGPGHPTARGDG